MIVRFILHHLLLVDLLMLLLPFLLVMLGFWVSRHRRRTGKLLAALGVLSLGGWLYGRYVASAALEVTHVEYESADLPAAFDGYRIVQFSDAHVGSLGDTRRQLLLQAVDSINAQRPDLIVFTGDLQNVRLAEVMPHVSELSRLHAADGVFAVLGNHDYRMYMNASDSLNDDGGKWRQDSLYAAMGWRLLRNEHQLLCRDSSVICIAGMENDGSGRFPSLGDTRKTLEGIGTDTFVVMLEHDPTSWHRHILPETHCQLTLSGHTHGGQMRLFGWSVASLRFKEVEGFYREADRALYVSRGLGGAIPFRLFCPGEITVITLKKKK